MPDLRERFRALDHLPQPDLWDEIEARALAVPTRSVTRAMPNMTDAAATGARRWSARTTSILVVVGLLAVLAVAAIVVSGARPRPLRAEIPSRAPLASPPASVAVTFGPLGEWGATAGMAHRRTEGHSVTLLGDGRVLVAGGGGPGGGDAWATAELFDPATGTWSATGDMLETRHHHAATLLPDGRVLVTGGGSSYASEVDLASAEVYDPRTGTWTAVAAMTLARQGHSATLLPDATVLVAGGRQWVPVDGGASTIDLAAAELYDPATGSWTATTEMPEHRDESTATLLLDGRVLFVGASAQVYDPATASWTPTGSLTDRHFGHTATLLRDGRVLVAGSGFPLRRRAELYDPGTGTWTPTDEMNEGRAWFAAGLLPDGRVLVAGSGDGGYGGSQTAELYDPGTGTWTLTPNLVSEHGYHEGVVLDDGRFLVVGGFPRTGVSAETYGVDH